MCNSCCLCTCSACCTCMLLHTPCTLLPVTSFVQCYYACSMPSWRSSMLGPGPPLPSPRRSDAGCQPGNIAIMPWQLASGKHHDPQKRQQRGQAAWVASGQGRRPSSTLTGVQGRHVSRHHSRLLAPAGIWAQKQALVDTCPLQQIWPQDVHSPDLPAAKKRYKRCCSLGMELQAGTSSRQSTGVWHV
jgi:hypothetical protein